MNLGELHDSIWSLLSEGVKSASSPFHTPALATVGNVGSDVRTVVLRSADSGRRQISCHTDWLLLHATGHQRAQLRWREEEWKAGWVTP